jgi:hypothetical protein
LSAERERERIIIIIPKLPSSRAPPDRCPGPVGASIASLFVGRRLGTLVYYCYVVVVCVYVQQKGKSNGALAKVTAEFSMKKLKKKKNKNEK